MSLNAMRQALYHDFAGSGDAVRGTIGSNVPVRLCFPFEDLAGGAGFWGDALAPLAAAWPDMERRDFIVIEGEDEYGAT